MLASAFFHEGISIRGTRRVSPHQKSSAVRGSCTITSALGLCCFQAPTLETPAGWKALKPLPGAYSLIAMIRFQIVREVGWFKMFKMPPTPLLSAGSGLSPIGRGWWCCLQDKPPRWAARGSRRCRWRCSFGWCPLANPSRRPPVAAGKGWKQPISPLLVFPLLPECKFLLPWHRINTPVFSSCLSIIFCPSE